MANICSRYSVRGCPASHYLKCEAFLTGRNCWETVNKPCCRETDLARCRSCSIYDLAIHATGEAERS
ncbi:MAG: hypothetical protein Q7T82_12190 [Armatimonadota bacterium]|nr:hypothetical protein [Armatimonadota bacterium]